MKESSNRSNQVFICTVIVSIAFTFLPLILRIPLLKGIISGYLAPLGEQKASYIETCGAILGSFLAITSAVWLQNRSDIASKNSEVRKQALVVFYDFDFALKEIEEFLKKFSSLRVDQKINNFGVDDLECYSCCMSSCRFYIDSEWISNTAKLSTLMKTHEIHQIYSIYGKPSDIQIARGINKNSIEFSGIERAYQNMLSLYDVSRVGEKYKFALTKENEDLIKSLAHVVGIPNQTREVQECQQ